MACASSELQPLNKTLISAKSSCSLISLSFSSDTFVAPTPCTGVFEPLTSEYHSPTRVVGEVEEALGGDVAPISKLSGDSKPCCSSTQIDTPTGLCLKHFCRNCCASCIVCLALLSR